MSASGVGSGAWCIAMMVPSGSRLGERRVEPGEGRRVEFAVVVARHARVEGDDAESADVEDPVHGLVARRLVEQALAERPPLVVVAHDPDEFRAGRVDERFDRRTHSTVGVGLAEVGHVAGHDDRVEGVAQTGELGDHLVQRPDGVGDARRAVLPRAADGCR